MEPPLILPAQFLKALKQIASRKMRGDSPAVLAGPLF